MAISSTSLCSDFGEGRLLEMLLGDSGYPLRKRPMTTAPVHDDEKRDNATLSKTRRATECCDGVLKRRSACMQND